MKVCICPIVTQVWLLSFMNCPIVLPFHKHNSSSLGQIRAFIFYLRCSKCVSSLANYHSQIRYGLRLIKLHNFSLPKRTLEYQIDGHILTRTRGSFLPLSLSFLRSLTDITSLSEKRKVEGSNPTHAYRRDKI